MAVVISEREENIRVVHDSYAAQEDSAIREGFNAVKDLLKIIDKERAEANRVKAQLDAVVKLAESCGASPMYPADIRIAMEVGLMAAQDGGSGG